MDEYSEQFERLEQLAMSIMELSRSTLMVNLRFLSNALSAFQLTAAAEKGLVCDGKTVAFFAPSVIRAYQKERGTPVHDLLHVVLHCIFRHNYIHTVLDEKLWSLACDIAVEKCISELKLRDAENSRSLDLNCALQELQGKVKQLTAEHIYHYLLDCRLNDTEYERLSAIFHTDDHQCWFEPGKDKLPGQSDGEENADTRGTGEGSPGDSDDLTEELWKEISENVQRDLETFSQQRGSKAGTLLQNLRAVNRERFDYAQFLKKFTVRGEACKVNDEEFDYIYYTYGLALYENMPLIEPLEYKELNRIRDFVIAIDTSGSVSGELVQRFIQKTYNILQSTDSFFTKMHLHILQCDAEIQSDVIITCKEDMELYIREMSLKGFGGTDFRPVFRYVDQLRQSKELPNLKGLIYFTDGYGIFPEHKPDYDAAFVFLDGEYNNYDVPAWAIRLVLSEEEI